MKTAITTALFSMLVAAACSSSDSRTDCVDGKCDTPQGSVAELCKASRVPAMDSSRPHFTSTGIRWSCKDVSNVTADSNTTDDRGQEYCEYFTMLHTDGIPSLITDANGPVFCDASTPCSTGVCDTSIFSCVSATTVDLSKPADILGKNLDPGSKVTPLNPSLSQNQVDWMAQNPTAKVGECVFTSWHNDIDREVTNTTEKIGGYSLDANAPGTSNPLFRMIVQFNANGAAKKLIQDCLVPGRKTIKDAYTRGCTFAGETGAGVPWRKSDPSVCTMAMRIAECGCKINLNDGTPRTLDLSNPSDLDLAEELFIPTGRRGFTLGTWDGIGQLPSGCKFVRTGDSSDLTVGNKTITDTNADQNIVVCDLNASHITAATSKDPKEACRTVYGDEVVVHIRAPDPSFATLSCDTTKPNCTGVPWDFSNLQ
jgi:hypothetical protein